MLCTMTSAYMEQIVSRREYLNAAINKKQVCICVPTENRPGMIADVLSCAKTYYPQFDLDVVYFDSSSDDRTKNEIKKIRDEGYDCFYYKEFPKGLCIDRKLALIFEKEESIRDYRYVWLINDSISITKEGLEEVFRSLENDPDMVRLPVAGEGDREDHKTHDINDWFHNCSKGMAHMASTVMNTRLLNGDIDWEHLYEKYVVNDDIYGEDHGFFYTVGFYLEVIAAPNIRDRFSGILIGNRVKWRRDSILKNGESYWNDIVFETWARSYPETILKIPDCYTDKENVARISDNILFGRFEYRSLIGYRIRGIFSKDVCEKYKKFWPLVTTLSYEELQNIADEPVGKLKEEYGEEYGRISNWKENLSRMEKSAQDRKIIVYGAGLYGEYVVSKLLSDGYEKQLAGVAVSDASKNVDRILDVPVRSIDCYDDNKNDALVIISTLPDTAQKIRSTLEEKGYSNIVLLF